MHSGQRRMANVLAKAATTAAATRSKQTAPISRGQRRNHRGRLGCWPAHSSAPHEGHGASRPGNDGSRRPLQPHREQRNGCPSGVRDDTVIAMLTDRRLGEMLRVEVEGGRSGRFRK